MPHPLVTQLRFARSEFVRGLEGVTPEEALRRFEPMNCISWIVGHLANQEHGYWVLWATGRNLAPALNELVGYGQPASTPALDEMWETWRQMTRAADQFLDTLTTEKLPTHLEWKGRQRPESIGTMLYRHTYHYWYHLGEAQAIRQLLGHRHLPQFVGEMSQALYRPE
ncbi:MAG: DinB family protein [Chloroflexi bacterium]|nr:DinB family protein [Chloroflexota bacterium]